MNKAKDGLNYLVRDHNKVRDLFRQFKGASALSSKQSIAMQISKELNLHAVVEEKLLYPIVRRAIEDGENFRNHSLDDHQVVKELLYDIEQNRFSEESLSRCMPKIMDSVEEHTTMEEEKIFPRLREKMNDTELSALETALDAGKLGAPDHSHPSAPNTPPGNMLGGPFLKIYDKAREAMGAFTPANNEKRE